MQLDVLKLVINDYAIQGLFSALYIVDERNKRYIECNIRRYSTQYNQLSKAVNGSSGCAVWSVVLWPNACCVCGFEYRCEQHGCLSVVSVVCCQVQGLCDGLITRPGESYRLCCVQSLRSRSLVRGGHDTEWGCIIYHLPLTTVCFIATPWEWIYQYRNMSQCYTYTFWLVYIVVNKYVQCIAV
jgi:hypothetical protein